MSKYANKYTKSGNNVYAIHYHLIFVVKYRKHIFTDETDIVASLKNFNETVATSFDVEILEQECDKDHIHLVVSTKPTLDIPNFVNVMKGHSSRFLRKEYSNYLKDKLWGDSLWSPSYFIASTGNVSIETLRKYVENQTKD